MSKKLIESLYSLCDRGEQSDQVKDAAVLARSHEQSRREFWMACYEVSYDRQSRHGDESKAAEDADRSLEEFDKRFKNIV